jgi:Predicted ATPase
LLNGKIVILDLSVGDPTLRERISQQIASDIFNKSMTTFVEGKLPPNIVVYIEEAHNLIGKDLDLTDTWPRLAKEGAKYRIALVYATQEVSSVHPNILANTENWFISHLNNDREIRELSRFYDFGDFGRSLLRAQDVGFTRVKTLSSPFVVPVQIDKFDPQQARTAGRASPWRQGRTNDNANASQADLVWGGGVMPYKGEFANKVSHSDIVRNPDIQKFLEDCSYLTMPSDQEGRELAAVFQCAPEIQSAQLPVL